MARKSKPSTSGQDRSKESNEEPQGRNGLFETVFRTFKAFLSLHIMIFFQELRDFGSAILTSLVLMLVAGIFLFVFWLLLNVLAILALHDFAGLSYFYSVLIIAVANMIVALLLLATARSGLRKKHFPQTKKLIQDTMNIFK